MTTRKALLVLVACAAAGAGLWFGLQSREEREPEALPPETPVTAPRAPIVEPKRGALWIRVRTSDDKALPSGSEAGYLVGNLERLVAVGEDGVSRFVDAPVGNLRILAKAPGYAVGYGSVQVVGGVPSEALVVLEPMPPR
jgi:hypothetical protein